MSPSRTRLYFCLMVMPAVFSLFPLEVFGISGNVLQRIPLFLSNGVPYLDLAVLPLLFVAIKIFLKGRAGAVDKVFIAPQIFIAIVWALFPQDLAANQSFGLFLGFSSIATYTVARQFTNYQCYRLLFQKTMQWQTIFSVFLAVLLILHVYGVLGYLSHLLVTIDRFEGESFRMRWDAVRGVEKMAACASVTWAMYRVLVNKKAWFLIVPAVFAMQQIAVSSRGGVLLVLICSLVPMFVFPPVSQRKGGGAKFLYLLLGGLVVIGGVSVILSTDSGVALVKNVGEFSDEDSIRNRMKLSALLLFAKAPIFGNGYFDLFATSEWSPFLLDNMLLPIHNVFLHYLVYVGLLGTALFGGVVIAAGLNFYFLRKKYLEIQSLEGGKIIELVGIALAVYIGGLYMIIFQTLDRVGALYLWGFCGLASGVLLSLRKWRIYKSPYA